MRNTMTCPYLKEVVMLYCDACHYRKMVPLEHLASASPCMGQDYRNCSLYVDIVARLGASLNNSREPGQEQPVFGREVTPS